MKITLKNFRCHANRSFDIPDKGLVALSGRSGAGKSTVLSAIVYAFYGKIPGKSKKTSRGKATTKVELCYGDLEITRTSRPNEIKVIQRNGDGEIEYQGDAAESIIQSTLNMNYEEFLAGAYIVQRSTTSVLSMTPTEQVKFIEVLSDSRQAGEFKELVKSKIKELRDARLKNQGQSEALQSQLAEIVSQSPEEPPEMPQVLQDGFDPVKARKEIKIWEKDLEDTQNSISKYNLQLQKARVAEKESLVIEGKISKVETEIAQLSNLAQKLVVDNTALEELEATLAKMAADVTFYTEGITAFNEMSQFKEAVHEYIESSKKVLATKEKPLDEESIKNLERKYDAAVENLKIYNERRIKFDFEVSRKENSRAKLSEIFKDIRKRDGTLWQKRIGNQNIKTAAKMVGDLLVLKKDFESVKENAKISRLCFECPLCNGRVILEGDHLVACDALVENSGVTEDSPAHIDVPNEDLDLEIAEIERLIREIEVFSKDLNAKISPDPGKSPEDPNLIQKALLRARRLKEDYENLVVAIASAEKEENLPTTLTRMKIRVENQIKGFVEWDVESLSGSLEKAKISHDQTRAKLEKAREAKLSYDEYQNSIKKKTKTLETLRASQPAKPAGKTKILEVKIGKLTQKLMSIQNSITTNRDILDEISEYENYQKHLEAIAGLEEKVNENLENGKDLDSRLEGFMGLSEAGRESEIVSLEKTVASINQHAKIYLDQMFDPSSEDGGITVKLECVKALKTKKTDKIQMNTTIEYKGEVYDSVEELSGGERQRCDCAYLMAINDMVNSPMILLDECLNNLDSEVNTEILTLIRDLCGGNKLVLVISHEAIRGVFDAEIVV